ncbi:polymer-forming cytoskeletal protein [Bacteriovoracaceae bacterium]|nr:polymer-forming cytoskeletal protein [Bacteriovoracaceae bacterium]
MELDSFNFKEKMFSQFGEGSHLVGDFNLQGIVKVSSRIEGNIFLTSRDSFLTIERSGYIKGKIECVDIEIFGHFQGDIIASGKIIIQAYAHVSGNISADTIAIYPGSVCNIEGKTLEQNKLQK